LGTYIFVCCECCVLSYRGLCDELITRSDESYRLWCVGEFDLETSWMRRPLPTGGYCTKKKNTMTKREMLPVWEKAKEKNTWTYEARSFIACSGPNLTARWVTGVQNGAYWKASQFMFITK